MPPTFAAPVLTHPNAAAEDDDAATPAVLLIDGPPGTPFVWHRVLPILRCCGVQPGTVKRPGFFDEAGPAYSDGPGQAYPDGPGQAYPDGPGQAYPDGPGQAADDPFVGAADIAELLDDQRHPPAVVVGHGLDIGIALALAAIAPHHVRALVLVGPAGGLEPISIVDRLLTAPMLGPVVTCLGFRAAGLALHLPALRRGVLATRTGVDPGDAKALVRDITFGPLWRTFVREERRLVSDARQRDQQLAGIDCPVLIIAGTHDQSVAPRAGRALHRLLPGAEVIATDAAPGQIPTEDPDSVVDAVLLALRREYRSSLSARAARTTG